MDLVPETISNCYYTMVRMTLPEDYSYESAFEDFDMAFDNVHDLWGLPETLKVHILSSHVPEYFAIEGVTCWSTSEETVEGCIKLYKRRSRTHKADIMPSSSESMVRRLCRETMSVLTPDCPPS